MRPTVDPRRFICDLRRKRYIDLKTGEEVLKKHIDEVCDLIDVEGKLVSPADWIKLCRPVQNKLQWKSTPEAWRKETLKAGLKIVLE